MAALHLNPFGSQSHVLASLSLSRPAPAAKTHFSTGEVNGIPTLQVTFEGKPLAAPISFGALMTDPAIWNHTELNDIVYQLGRSLYNKDAYEFCGLVAVQGKTFLGVRWYSPTASQQPVVVGVVLQFRVVGDQLIMTLTTKGYGWIASWPDQYFRGGKIPAIERSSDGNLLLIGWNGNWKLLPNGKWQKTGRH